MAPFAFCFLLFARAEDDRIAGTAAQGGHQAVQRGALSVGGPGRVRRLAIEAHTAWAGRALARYRQ